MSNITIQDLAQEVIKMRLLQNAYFKAKKQATRTRMPAHFEDAAAALIESKVQEDAVDKMVERIVKAA